MPRNRLAKHRPGVHQAHHITRRRTGRVRRFASSSEAPRSLRACTYPVRQIEDHYCLPSKVITVDLHVAYASPRSHSPSWFAARCSRICNTSQRSVLPRDAAEDMKSSYAQHIINSSSSRNTLPSSKPPQPPYAICRITHTSVIVPGLYFCLGLGTSLPFIREYRARYGTIF